MAQQMEFGLPTKRVNFIEAFRGFISKYKINPISKSKIIIAKDISYQYQQSEDSYVLLLPLVVKNLYMYVQSYIDANTELTEHCIKIAKIDEMSLSEKASIYKFDGSKKRDEARLNKGVRYVTFLCDFFDPDKNKALYKTTKNSRLVAERKIKYDSDKIEYQDNCGFVELQHQRIQIENKNHNYVHILACKSYKGEKMPARVSSILFDEFKYVYEYLKFIIHVYKLNDLNMADGVSKKYIETAQKDVVMAIENIEKTKKDKESTKKIETSVGIDDNLMICLSSSRKRKNNSAMESSKKEKSEVNQTDGDEQNNEDSDVADEKIIKEKETDSIEDEVVNAVKIGKMKKGMDSEEGAAITDADDDYNEVDDEDYSQVM